MNSNALDHDNSTHINNALNELVAATRPSDVRTLLEEHPELLTDAINDALEANVRQLSKAQDTTMLPAAQFVADLVRYCRIVGVINFTGALEQASTADAGRLQPASLRDQMLNAFNSYQDTGDSRILAELTTIVALAYVALPAGPLQAPFSEALGVGLRRHFKRTSDESALTRAIRALRLAVAQIGEDSPMRTSYLSNLGNALRNWASASSSPHALRESVAVQRAALDLANSDQRLEITANLSAALIELFTTTQDRAALDEAINILQREREQSTADSRLPVIDENLQLALSHRFDQSGDVTNLSAAIDVGRGATTRMRITSEVTGATRQLAADLRRRFEVLSADADLEEAIGLLRGIIAAVPESDKIGVAASRAELARALDARFQQRGTREDLHEAQELLEDVVARSQDDPVLQAEYINNLGVIYRTRFEASDKGSGSSEMLARAVECFEEAIPVLAAHRRHAHMAEGNLAAALVLRFEETGDERDLTRAVELGELALSATPADSDDYPLRLTELSIALRLVSRIDASTATADRSIALMEDAVLASGNSPRRFAMRHNLAAALIERHLRANLPADLDRGMSLLLGNAREAREISPTIALRSAMDLGRLHGQRDQWAEAALAYEMALDSARRVVEAQVRWTETNVVIRNVRDLPQLAAYAFAKSGNAASAIDALERGRTYMLHSMLDRRPSELLDLHVGEHAHLAIKYEGVVDRLRFLDTALADHPTAAPPRADLVREILNARHSLVDITDEIRSIPGHESFSDSLDSDLDAPPITVVYFVAAPVGGLLLIRSPGQSSAESVIVHCPELNTGATLEHTKEFLRRPASASRDIGEWTRIIDDLTRWLWDVAMGAVVKCLGSDPEVVLVPTGLLSLLPWHAAWRPDLERGRIYALDELRLSYAPTARILNRPARANQLDAKMSLLLVVAPDPVEAPALLLAQTEAESVKGWFGEVTLLSGNAATRDAALEELGVHSAVHLICHGLVALEHPLDSFLLFAGNSPLTLRDILTLPLDRVRLVVLSACDTAAYSFVNPDEVLSLASGFIAGGVAEAVASLWPVPDVSTTLLMSALYRFWMGDMLPPAEALRRAQKWVRDSSNDAKFEACPELFDETVRNLSPAARRTWGRSNSFSSSIHWSAFTHNGWAGHINRV